MHDGANISFIGFGEAARAFTNGLMQEGAGLHIRAFDIKTDSLDADAMYDAYREMDVSGVATCADACAGADLIFSLVTADQAEEAAKQAAQTALDGALFLDCNSCAPNTKRRSAEIINAAGGRYVDVAVMTPVHPKLHKSPCLLAGPHAESAHTAMTGLGMATATAGANVGDASTRKMIRSTMIKGLEALTLECFLAARQAGIDSDILESLEASFPGFDWATRAPYMMERAATHGIRRAAEMEEVAKTLSDLGITPFVTTGTVQRQREIGGLGLAIGDDDAKNLAAMADILLAGLLPKATSP